MITKDGPSVLEFNVRFGDPETQAILPRLKSDIIDVIDACIDGRLKEVDLEWDERACLCVVAASKGYPGAYEKNKEIHGLRDVKEAFIFHAGSISKEGTFFTSGGRVLGVAGLGKDISSAKDRAYREIKKINFDGICYRNDIGDKAIRGKYNG